MAYRRDRAIVLRKETIRDHDRRYTLYGRDHGLCTVFAAGASRPTSKHAGHLEPFSEVDVMLAHGRYTDRLAVASQRSAVRFAAVGGYLYYGRLCDLVSAMVRPGVADARLFTLLSDARAAAFVVTHGTSPARLRFLFAGSTLKLLDLLGYAPNVDGDGHVSRIIRLLRDAPLHDALRITAERDLLDHVSEYIEHELYSTYLEPSFPNASLFAAYQE